MSKLETWITPIQAIGLMQKKLGYLETEALAIWSRDGDLRSRAKHIEYTDDWRGFMPSQRYPNYIWMGKLTANWTTGELTSIINTEAFAEQWNISGIQFLKNDILRCIAKAKGHSTPKERADLNTVTAWVECFIEEQGIVNVRKRAIEDAVKEEFPNRTGATAIARAVWAEARAKHKNCEMAQENKG